MAALTEADVLFELLLPLLCDAHGEAMARFKGHIEFHMTSEPPRVWHVSASPKPWVKRGSAPRPADVIVVMSQALVEGLAQGRDVDLERAVAQGSLVVHGDLKVLQAFELSLAEAESALATMVKQRK